MEEGPGAAVVEQHGQPKQLTVVAAGLDGRVQVPDQTRQHQADLSVQAPLLGIEHRVHPGGQLLDRLYLPGGHTQRHGLQRSADRVDRGVRSSVPGRRDRQRGQLAGSDL